MDSETQQRVNGYVALFDAIAEKTESDAVAIAILQEMSKDRRGQQMSGERVDKNGKPATDRQKRYLRKLGLEFPENITKAEASALIDEELGKNGD